MLKKTSKTRSYGEGSVFLRKDGRWCSKYRPEGEINPKYIYSKTEAEAKRKLREFKKGIMLGMGGTKRVFFNDYFERWLVVYKRNIIRDVSFDKYEETYRTCIKPRFKQKQLCSITPKDIHNVFEETKENTSYDRALKMCTLIRGCFEHACNMGDMPSKKNPMLYSKMPDESHYPPKRPIVVFEKEEVELLENAAKMSFKNGKTRYDYGNLIIFFLQTGIRRGELLGLKWSDIDLKNKIVHIRRSVVKTRVFELEYSLENAVYEYKHLEGLPKTKKGKRDIPLNQKAINALHEYKKNAIVKGKLHEYVARSATGKPVSSYMLSRTLKRMCQITGIKVDRYSIHGLRHTFATRLLRAGVLVEQVSQWLGHASTSTTLETYSHLMITDKIKSIKILEWMWAAPNLCTKYRVSGGGIVKVSYTAYTML